MTRKTRGSAEAVGRTVSSGTTVLELGGVVAEGVLGRPQRPIDREYGDVGEHEKDDDQPLDPCRSTSDGFRSVGLDHRGRVEAAVSSWNRGSLGYL